jgi:tetratricopeptide (TPR) repeat protein
LWLGALTSAAAQGQQPADAPNIELAAGADAGDYIASLRNARDSLMLAGDFEAALSPAELAISEIEASGLDDVTADRVVLATILAELDRFDEAELTFLDAIANLGESEGEFSLALVRPMQLLGRTYIRARRFPQAITVLDEARHISQRNEGLFNVDQSTLIDDMTTAYLGVGDTAAAQKLQFEQLTNAQRRFGAENPQVIPFHNSLAEYLSRSRLHSSARHQYEAILEIARTQLPEDPLAAMAPLRNIARIDLLTGNRRDALDELEAMISTATGIDAYELGLTLAVLGDRAIVEDEPREARALYARSYASIEASGRTDPNDFFADPEIIRFIPPLLQVDRGLRSLPYAWGTIVLEFSVGTDGRVSEVSGVGASPEGLVETAYVERLQDAFFRPQILDGKPVAATSVRLTHYFRYYVEAEENNE